ncbi:MAG TPA: hypothetical protein H9768_07330 [Candidatus Mailhella merdavium]|nr:hypothetical protein [Candidatus Mailhella merdavium]
MGASIRPEVQREADLRLMAWQRGDETALKTLLLSLLDESCPQAEACARYLDEKTGGALFDPDDGATQRPELSSITMRDYRYLTGRLLRNFSRETFEAAIQAGSRLDEVRADRLPAFLAPEPGALCQDRGDLQRESQGQIGEVVSQGQDRPQEERGRPHSRFFLIAGVILAILLLVGAALWR